MDSSLIIVYEIIIFILIVMSSFFSGSETAIVSANRLLLEKFAKNKKRGAKNALWILDHIEDSISMVLIGNNIANITTTSFITFLATKAYLLDEKFILIVTVVQTVVFLIFCEVSPKIIAKSKSDKFLLKTAFILKILVYSLKPIVWFSSIFTSMIKKISNVDDASSPLIRSREEISLLFKLGEKDGVIDRDRKYFVSEILSFKNITALSVMTPATDVVSIEINASVKDVVELMEKTKFSRILLFEKIQEDVVGYIYFRDLMQSKEKLIHLQDFLVPGKFIPSTKNVYELYLEMQEEKTEMIFVVNEHSNFIGIITLEDIAEKIVGEIHSGDHPDEELITIISDKKFIVDGGIDIDYFQRVFNITIEKKGFETLAGLLMTLMQKIPQKGEKIVFKGLTFKIEKADKKGIDKILVKSTKPVKLN